MTTKPKNPKTYKRGGATHWKCSGCNKEHALGVYVAAHWDETLIHTCDQCGAKHSVLSGKIRREP